MRRDLRSIDPDHRKMLALGQDSIEELKRIAESQGGVIRAQDVLAEARKKDSPLHHRFEWDDTEAAEKYRMIQARALISISAEVTKGSNVPTRVFVSLKNERWSGGGYRTAVSVLSNEDMQQQLLQDALENMEYFREKFKRLQQLSDVMETMKQAEQRLKTKRLSSG